MQFSDPNIKSYLQELDLNAFHLFDSKQGKKDRYIYFNGYVYGLHDNRMKSKKGFRCGGKKLDGNRCANSIVLSDNLTQLLSVEKAHPHDPDPSLLSYQCVRNNSKYLL